MWAILRSHPAAVEALVAAGADINLRGRPGRTAARGRNSKAPGDRPTAPAQRGGRKRQEPGRHDPAALRRRPDTSGRRQTADRQAAPISTPGTSTATPPCTIPPCAGDQTTTELLIARGAEVNSMNKNGQTPLAGAVTHGSGPSRRVAGGSRGRRARMDSHGRSGPAVLRPGSGVHGHGQYSSWSMGPTPMPGAARHGRRCTSRPAPATWRLPGTDRQRSGCQRTRTSRTRRPCMRRSPAGTTRIWSGCSSIAAPMSSRGMPPAGLRCTRRSPGSVRASCSRRAMRESSRCSRARSGCQRTHRRRRHPLAAGCSREVPRMWCNC
jgi:hypothetical protein